jgi:hypothetical protein
LCLAHDSRRSRRVGSHETSFQLKYFTKLELLL